MIPDHADESRLYEESRMQMSRLKSKKKNQSKLSMFETNMDNYDLNKQYALQKMNPKGLIADAIYFSFTGVIQSADLFLKQNEDLQVSYSIIMGEEWHNESIEQNNVSGASTICEAKDGKVTFSVGFDCLFSCVYIQSYPQLIMEIRGFNNQGQIITKGYAQMHLPIEHGIKVKQAYIYGIHREQRWYEKLFRFLAPNPLTLEQKECQRIIGKGQGRQVQKIRSLGKIRVSSQVLKRNYNKFGYN